MAASYKSPGVFVEEISKLPPSVAEVETAIPAFIGYTERAEKNGESRLNKATAIESMTEFESIFGGAAGGEFTAYLDAEDRVSAVEASQPYLLHESLRLFFENGGGRCYIIAVGAFKPSAPHVDADEITRGLAELEKQDEPTIIVCPDATLLASPGLYDYQKRALAQCAKLGDRVALCDTYPSDESVPQETFADRVQQFRDNIGINDLKYGAAYVPYVRSSLPKKVQFRDIVLKRGTPEASTDVDLKALTADSAIAQLVFDLEGAKKASDDLAGMESTTPSGILTAPSTTIEGQFKTLLDVGAPTDDQIKAVYGFVLEFFAALEAIKDGLPTKVPPTPPPPPSSTTSAAFLLKDELESLAQTSGVVDAFETLVLHSKGYGEGTATAELLHDAAARAPALDVLGITEEEYNALEDAEIAALYDGAEDPAKNAEARKAINAFYPVLVKYYGALEAAARSYETTFDASLEAAMGVYKRIKSSIAAAASEMPPSGPVAGVYARVDAQRGVWKAPANVSLAAVSEPVVQISAEQQENLNVDPVAGKSLNAIRTFTGKGVMVWGARTLAGNDNEWRYVNVRRFFNMVEESCKKASEPFVFEPNDANTWVRVQGMIKNFLTLQWRAGALQGAKPEDAFYVAVGLNKTMTSLDVLEGRMIIEIGMAVVRPAEFIVLRFSHLLAQS